MRASSKFQVPSFKLKLVALIFGFILGSCHSGTQKTTPANKSDESGVAKFVFPEEIHNFGSLKAGELVSFTFTFRNEGTKTLTVTGIDSGCGCTEVKIENKGAIILTKKNIDKNNNRKRRGPNGLFFFSSCLA
jgi:hypothetical protein